MYQGTLAYYGTHYLWAMKEVQSLWLLGTSIYTLAFLLVTIRIALDFRIWTVIT